MAPLTEPGARRSLSGRRVLVVSHDFPPVRSPQAIRSWHFVHAIAREAADVVVLCRTPPAGQPLPTVPANVRLHPASPGGFESLIDGLVSWRHRHRGQSAEAGAPRDVGPISLNWKGRLVRSARRLLDLALYPDSRVCWSRHAGQALDGLLAGTRPDVALVMHEPAASLLLGERLHLAGVPWIADLADPVMAPYTPRHWRKRAFALEAATLRTATRIAVTNMATAELLAERHGRLATQPLILSQGHGEAAEAPTPAPQTTMPRDERVLRLCYTGRFYTFRRVDEVVAAIAGMDGVQLVVAGPEPPAVLREAAKRWPAKFELHGELSHAQALALQRSADALLSIGNAGTVQSPGKLFEYFGAGRPVLHVASNRLDPQIGLIAGLRRGLSCDNETSAVRERLLELRNLKATAGIEERFDLSTERVQRFGWAAIGRLLVDELALLVEPTRGSHQA